MRVLLGGPAYRLQMDARHAAAMITLTHAVQPIIAGPIYLHGCPVEDARNRVMRQALDAEHATHLLSVDSDCWADVETVLAMFEFAAQHSADAAVALPVPQRDGRCNVFRFDDVEAQTGFERVFYSDISGRKPFRAAATGAAFILLNLDWYRAHWDRPPWFRTFYPEDGGTTYFSEDTWHTMNLGKRGSAPWVYTRGRGYHAPEQ